MGICLHCVASTVHVATLCAFFRTIFFLLSVRDSLKKVIKIRHTSSLMQENTEPWQNEGMIIASPTVKREKLVTLEIWTASVRY